VLLGDFKFVPHGIALSTPELSGGGPPGNELTETQSRRPL
jgi:hypothetical protein